MARRSSTLSRLSPSDSAIQPGLFDSKTSPLSTALTEAPSDTSSGVPLGLTYPPPPKARMVNCRLCPAEFPRWARKHNVDDPPISGLRRLAAHEIEQHPGEPHAHAE